jgi:hypothetical protein
MLSVRHLIAMENTVNRIRAVNVYLVLLLAVPVWLDAQEGGPTTKAGRDRASLAQMFEQAFHEEGCAN